MKVYIVRHGESETNLQKKWTGWLDVELTNKGIEDAKKVTPVLKDIVFDKVYASDLKRAKKTAEIALPNCEYETSSLLREIDVGNFAGKPLSIYDTLTPEEKELNLKNAFKDFGGESVEDLTKRVETFIKELETKDFNNDMHHRLGFFFRTEILVGGIEIVSVLAIALFLPLNT